MNLKLIKINVIVLVIVVESQGGLIDGIYGRVQNTTTGLRQDVRNVWSYSKGLLVGQNTTEPKEEERGLIGGMIHSVHEKVHNFKEKFWDVDEIPSDSGLLWSWWNRMKQRLSRAKDFITGKDAPKPIEEPPKEETKMIADTLNTLFYENGTRRVHGKAFDEAVENLRKKLGDIRKISGTSTETPDKNIDGEELIDVRFAGARDIRDNIEDNAVGIGNDIYDKVDESAKKVDGNARESISAISDNAKSTVEKGLVQVQTGYEKVKEGSNALGDKVSDAVAKEKDLLDTTYKKLNQGARNIGDSVKQSADDMARL